MPIRLLTFFFAFLALVMLVLAFFYDNSTLALGSIPFVLIAAILFVMTPQLEWQFYKKKPADLEEPIINLFDMRLPAWYSSMNTRSKEEFRKNVFLTRLGIDFKAQGFEEEGVPLDVQALIAAQAVRIMKPADEHVLLPFEIVVLYRHAFPSPQYPEQWHSCENFEEDGVLLFGLERALPGMFEPQQHFNIVLYEWIRAAKISRGGKSEITSAESWEENAQQITNRPCNWIHEAIGLREIDGDAVLETLRMEFQNEQKS